MAASREHRGELAIVTGAASGIGYALAQLCAQAGFDLIVAADEAKIHEAAESFRRSEVIVEAIQTDLATLPGVETVYSRTHARPVAVLISNTSHGLDGGFLEQDFAECEHVINTNITGTIYLIQKIAQDMRERGAGRILMTGSSAALAPGGLQAVHNGTRTFINSFASALRAELVDSGVHVACLMPGANETNSFEWHDTLGARLARAAFDALMKDDQKQTGQTEGAGRLPQVGSPVPYMRRDGRPPLPFGGVRPLVPALLAPGHPCSGPGGATAISNHHRFNFGVLEPPDIASPERGSVSLETQCLLRAAGSAVVDGEVRFFHARATAGGPRSTEDAVERVVPFEVRLDEPSNLAGRVPFAWPAIADRAHPQEAISGVIEIGVALAAARPELYRITVRVRNTTPAAPEAVPQRDTLSRSLLSTHALLKVDRGEFISLLDPPPGLEEEAAACRQTGLWPVLTGAPGTAATILASPIILNDHPQIIPDRWTGKRANGQDIH